MEWLNYHHLHYFWVVARTGSIARACAELRLTQPTISGQIQKLEGSLGAPLFTRQGRGLALTETGRLVFRYADEIFSLGREMVGAVRGHPTGRPARLSVGIADAIPKLVAHRLLSATATLPQKVVLVCTENRPDRLVADLAVQALDLVLSDTPLPPGAAVRLYNHLLGECGVVLCAAPSLARQLGLGAASPRGAREQPTDRLNGAPFLMPAEGSQLRSSLELWLRDRELVVEVAAELDDSALLKVFGSAGAGVFAVPDVIEKEVCAQYSVRVVARLPEIRERYYAISAERRIRHPAVAAISASARHRMFG
ncbi:MAG: LysR family transcriptional regulator [Polyangiaceae bacterium]